MYTAQKASTNGVESVVRCASLAQLRDWCIVNGHVIVTGYAAEKAMRSGACVRMIRQDGRVMF